MAPAITGAAEPRTASAAPGSRRALFAWSALVAAQVLLSFGGPQLWTAPEDRIYRYSNAALALLQYGVILAIVLIIARPSLRSVLALRPPRSWTRAAASGVVLLVGTIVLLAVLDPLLRTGEAQNLSPEWDPDRALPFAVNAVVIALVSPVVEELWFRGLGLTLLLHLGSARASVITGVTFALSHGLIEILPIATALGIGLAYVRTRTDSLYPGIIVHVILNALGVSSIMFSS